MAHRRCMRCKRRWRGQGDWNTVYVGGRDQGLICPDCQTPDEAEEAIHNLASGATDSLTEATDARVIDTDALIGAAEYAIEHYDGGLTLELERLEEFDAEQHHVVVATGHQDLPDYMLVGILFGSDVDRGHVVAAEGVAPTVGFLQVRPTDWMGWEQRPTVGTELQGRVTQLAKDYLRSVGA